MHFYHDLLSEIFSFFNRRKLCHLCYVCKKWNNFVGTQFVERPLRVIGMLQFFGDDKVWAIHTTKGYVKITQEVPHYIRGRFIKGGLGNGKNVDEFFAINHVWKNRGLSLSWFDF